MVQEISDVDVRQLMERRGAILSGHFVLSSGLHSATYIQCALLLQHPADAETVGRALSMRVRQLLGNAPDVVLSPALGGIIIGYEVARALGVRFGFTERQNGKMTLRRGQKVESGEKVVVIEDVVTTGRSTREVIEVATECGAKVIAVGAIVNRSHNIDFGVPFAFLVKEAIENYRPDDCPLCKAGQPLTKPGSRPGCP